MSLEPADRHALYYPYIHIKDENWLKGTILAFRQVRRIVPAQFTVKDQNITRPYAELSGPDGEPLLRSVFIVSNQVRESQEWLSFKIEQHLHELKARYAKKVTPPRWHGGPDAFEIHVRKFVAPDLLDCLLANDLGWHSRELMEHDSCDWVTMHPILASAIMSILALAVARLEGLCVVTPSSRAHNELLANREELVFEKLLGVPMPIGATRADEVAVEELAHIVITTGFDLTRLTPSQICELVKDGKDLRAFRRTLSGFVSRIPPGLGHSERTARLKMEAQSVLDEWARYTSQLPTFAKEALVDSALERAQGLVKEGVSSGTATVVAHAPTVAISLIVAAGKMFRNRDTPLRFLSRVHKAADRSIGSIYVPQWRALSGQTI